jgi:glycosidase
MRERLTLDEVLAETRAGRSMPRILYARHLARRLNRLPERHEKPVPAGTLNLFGLLGKIFRYLVDRYEADIRPAALEATIAAAGASFDDPGLVAILTGFAANFPGEAISLGREQAAAFLAGDADQTRKRLLVRELLLLRLAAENPALDPFRELFDDTLLEAASSWRKVAADVDRGLAAEPPFAPLALSLPELLRAPVKASPHSLAGQVEFIKEHWREILPPELLEELLTSLDIVREEEREFRGGAGRPRVLEFLKNRLGHDYPEYERFSPDADWMANVVMIAKMVYVWLDQLAKKYGRSIHRLDQIPDEEIDCLARRGFTALWLIGLWERSPSSAKIKQIGGNPEAISSAYSLYDYMIAADLGGEEALASLKERCRHRGIRLASDMVPNHTGIYSKWTVEHPDWFVQLDYPPYPAYNFSGPDLSFSPEVSLVIEDGYWNKRDAAVVFKHYDHRNGRTRYIYHGNDGTSTPWNDTAQLNYLLPEVREAVIRTIIHVARLFPIIRFDAAMTLAKKHYQRLWYPQPGHGSGVPSRAEHGMSREEFDAAFPAEFWREVVDRVAAEVPDTLLLAEAFWLMEGYFVRTLGMHRVYNSAFMNMLKMEENAKYRQTIKNVLEYDPRILQRFVNFMNNPDERTAVEQFGKEGKYFGACVLLVTMPGLPMFGHGQVEGFHEKYGMEYKRAYWDEPVDERLVSGHEARIFPLMRKRYLFSGSAHFVFYDFFTGSQVDENVFAYSNRAGEERGMIIYNNRFGDSAGWIRTSTTIAVPGGPSDAPPVQTTVGEALGCNPGGRFYYSFRDYATGLEYLRAGRELGEKGMFVELAPYQYYAFLDFREIADDDFGTWGKLCASLQGRPVASLDEEVKQVRYGEVIGRFRAVVKSTALLLKTPERTRGDLGRLGTEIENFYAVLNANTVCSGDTQALAGGVSATLAMGAELVALLKEREAELPLGAPGLPELPVLLAAYLVLRRAGTLAPADDYPRTAAAWFDELGLARAFGELIGEAGVAGILDAAGYGRLLELLLGRQKFFAAWDRAEAAGRLRELFIDSAARKFLQCHWSGGFEWFAKERFELLMAWLGVAGVVDRATVAGKKGKQLPGMLKELHLELSFLYDRALAAGYQPGDFLKILEKEGQR